MIIGISGERAYHSLHTGVIFDFFVYRPNFFKYFACNSYCQNTYSHFVIFVVNMHTYTYRLAQVDVYWKMKMTDGHTYTHPYLPFISRAQTHSQLERAFFWHFQGLFHYIRRQVAIYWRFGG